ncbi:MAG: pyridoxal phosphate-dependent aminotransferase [Flavisolibacter sp.]
METSTETINFEVADRLSGVGEYYFSQKLREIEAMNRSGAAVINLGIGSPDLPPHPDVIRVLQEEAAKDNTHAYQSYKGILPLREAIADWYRQQYGVSLDAATEVLPLIGSKEGIMHVSMTYVNPGTTVLVPNPGYPTYSSAATLAGGKILHYELKEENNWFPDFDALEEQLKGANGTVLMFVNYPHMPTGQLPTDEMFESLVAFARRNRVLICHDNPYSFILNDTPKSLLQVPGAKDVVLELNSLSKSHNMAGWRVGMLCGSADKIDQVLRFKSNMDSGMFLPLQKAAAKALSLPKSWYDDLNAVYAKRKKVALELIELLECNADSNQVGLFVWARIPAANGDCYAFTDKILQQAKVFITPGGIFGSGGNQYIRISLCSTEAVLQQAIERIKKMKAA